MFKEIQVYLSRFRLLIILTVLLILPLILSPAFARPYLDSKRAFLNFTMPLGIGAFLCSLLISRDFLVRVKYLFLPALYVLFIFISALFSRNIELSLFAALQQFLLVCGGFWLGFSLYGRRNELGKVLITITAVAIFVSIHSFSQFIGHDFLYRFFPWKIVEGGLIHYRHIPGTLGNPDYVGGFLMILSFWILLGCSWFNKKSVFLPVFFLTFFVTIITQTRSAIVGLLGGLLFLLLSFRKYQNIHFRKSLLIILSICFIMLLAGTYIVGNVFTGFTEFFLQRMHSAVMLMESSFKVRLLHWQITTDMFLDNWLLGISPGMYRIEYLEYLLDFAGSPAAEPFENVIKSSGGRLAGEAHNDFFQIFAEYGLIAGAAFFFIISWYFVSVAGIYRKKSSEGVFLVIFSALLIAVLIHAFFSFPFQLFVRAFYIWFTLGAAFSMIYNINRKHAE